MTWEETWGILKWVLAALAAGFIGQFGKSFALHLLRRRRARRGVESEAQDATRTSVDTSGAVASTDASAEVEKARLDALAKIEKKRAKAEVKRLKKS
jgi:hypothetical protein